MSGDKRGAPSGASTTACGVKHACSVMAGSGAGIGCQVGRSMALTRFWERPATGLAKVIGRCTTKENRGAVASGATATPVQDRGLKGR